VIDQQLTSTGYWWKKGRKVANAWRMNPSPIGAFCAAKAMQALISATWRTRAIERLAQKDVATDGGSRVVLEKQTAEG